MFLSLINDENCVIPLKVTMKSQNSRGTGATEQKSSSHQESLYSTS